MINIRDEYIDDLKYKLSKAYDEIDGLEKQISKLKKMFITSKTYGKDLLNS